MPKVPYLSEESLQREADILLAQFARAESVLCAPPIPIERILEAHLRLSLDLDDLHTKLGIPVIGGKRDILGALWVDQRSVFIDRSLDPEEHPGREGRYRFTLAHEVGHWQLHQQYVPSHVGQTSLFVQASEHPTVICRLSQAQEPIELQANIFAACVVMPREMVFAAWERRFGNRRSHIIRAAEPIRLGWDSVFTRDDPDDVAVRQFVRPFAEQFLVSVEAMRIRLETLRLLCRSESGQPRLVPTS